MTNYDTVIVGGEVVDPGAGIVGPHDVAIAAGRVALIAPRIEPGPAARVIDARGQIVTPGLVDLHTHIYWGATYWGVEAEPIAATASANILWSSTIRTRITCIG